jgi:hypothetical protein
VPRRAYVESSDSLGVAASVPGDAWDVAGNRVLYLDRYAPTPTLRIRDIVTEDDEEIAADARLPSGTGFGSVAPHGALYTIWDDAAQAYHTFDWRDGTTVDLGMGDVVPKVVGAYALFSRSTPTAGTVVRRDLETGAEVIVATTTAPGFADVAPNGDVVYVDGVWGGVYRYRAGATTKISSDPDGVVTENPCAPLTDGSSVAYWRSGVSYALLHVNDGTSDVAFPADTCWYTYLAGEWVAYGLPSSSWYSDVWRHGPSGEELVASAGSAGYASARALAPDGTVVLDMPDNLRYRATPGAALEPIGSTLGTVLYRDGRFLVLIGGSVLEVLP